MSSEKICTIYVALLDEGTAVWRPVEAERLRDGRFQIVSANPDPETETWEFPSGSIVQCEERELYEETLRRPRLVAGALAGHASS